MSDTRPEVSIVLICFDDEARLGEAIASARAQTLDAIEIIIVDHGSTDGSLAVATSAAEQDPRIRVIALGVHEGRAGVPINAGLAAARAPWATVFASDDVLTPHACERMLAVAQRTRADIVVGSVARVDMATGERTRWMPSVSQRARVVTSIDQLPDLIRDTLGGGKLYSTEFIRTHGLSMPPHLAYQDQLFTMSYYAAASSVAITPSYVLEWRHWPQTERLSVTQRRSEVQNLEDRFTVNRMIDERLSALGRRDLLIVKQRKFLAHDLYVHVKGLADASAHFRQTLIRRTRSYVRRIPRESYAGLALNRRIMVELVRRGRLDEAERVAETSSTVIMAEWRRATCRPRFAVRRREVIVPPWAEGETRYDPAYDVSDYRLRLIPERSAARRATVRLAAKDRAVTVDVALASAGRLGRKGLTTLRLEDSVRGRVLTAPLRRVGSGRQWRATVTLAALESAFKGRSCEVGLLATFGVGTPLEQTLSLGPAEVNTDERRLGRSRWSVRTTDDDTALVRTVMPSPDTGRGTSDQFEVLSSAETRSRIRSSRVTAADGRVFFESFAGQRASDGPLAVSQRLHERRPDVEQFWSYAGSTLREIPAYATAVPRHTPAWVGALATSATWIDNGWLDQRPLGRRRLVQLGAGVDFVAGTVADRTPPWTFRVTSGHFEEEILTAVHPDPVTFLRTGAPRTDALLAPAAGERRQALREAWGLADRTVVLFAPILREGEVSRAYRHPDLHRLAAELGTDWFWLLREHDDDATGRRTMAVPDDLRWFGANANWRIDPVAHLLVADVLVTDYSSLAVDAGLSGAAVVHWVPDLVDREAAARPPALRLHEDRFGPVALDDTELIAALRVVGDPATRASAVAMAESLARRLAPASTGHAADALLDELGF